MPGTADRDRMTTDLREAAKSLDAALADFPKGVTAKLSPAEVALARVRDALIARARSADGPDHSSAVLRALDRANRCLSLVVGMEYPQGSSKKPPVEQARALVDELAAEVESLPAAGPPDARAGSWPSGSPLSPEEVSPSFGVRERIEAAGGRKRQ